MPILAKRLSILMATALLIGGGVTLFLLTTPITAGGEESAGNAAESQYGEGEGCTPGYWKNHTDSWAASGYSPTDDFDTVFGTDLFDPDITLLEAADFGGGGVNALARHAVAALLNAGNPDIGYTLSQEKIKELVQGAGGDPEPVKDTFDAFNNDGCPIDAQGEVTG